MADPVDPLALLPPGYAMGPAVPTAAPSAPQASSAVIFEPAPGCVPPELISLVPGLAGPPTWWFMSALHFAAVPDLTHPLGRIWAIGDATVFRDIPAAERWAASAVMRAGQAVAVVGHDAGAVAAVETALRRVVMLDGDGGWCGHG